MTDNHDDRYATADDNMRALLDQLAAQSALLERARVALEISEILAEEADRADKSGGWSFLLLQRMAKCAQSNAVHTALAGQTSSSPSPTQGGEPLLSPSTSIRRGGS